MKSTIQRLHGDLLHVILYDTVLIDFKYIYSVFQFLFIAFCYTDNIVDSSLEYVRDIHFNLHHLPQLHQIFKQDCIFYLFNRLTALMLNIIINLDHTLFMHMKMLFIFTGLYNY